MKRKAASFAALVAGAVIAFSVPSSPEDVTATIAAWNVKGFGGVPRDRASEIAQGIADLDAEVIALAEINPPELMDWLIEDLNGHGPSWYRAAFIDQSANLDLGVLYKAGVEVANSRLIAGSDNGNSSLRQAFVTDVRVGEFDFFLITLHLKAGRGSSNRTIRDFQTQAISNFVTNLVQGAEKDVLIVGDYNMIPGQDDSNFQNLAAGGFIRFISSEDLTGQASHVNGNLLDGYAISAIHTGEYIPATLQIFPIHRAYGLSVSEFDDEVSDHFPLVARFRINQDDD